MLITHDLSALPPPLPHPPTLTHMAERRDAGEGWVYDEI